MTALSEYVGFANNACLMIEGASLTNLTGYIAYLFLLHTVKQVIFIIRAEI